jgi:hypothetical protein
MGRILVYTTHQDDLYTGMGALQLIFLPVVKRLQTITVHYEMGTSREEAMVTDF